MPQDTIYLPGNVNLPAPLSDTAVRLIRERDSAEWQFQMQSHFDSLEQAVSREIDKERPSYPAPTGTLFFMVLGVLVLSAYFYIIRPAQAENKKRFKYRSPRPEEDPVREMQYDGWLKKYNPYYASLDAQQQKKFIYRVQKFMATKEFRFHSMVEEEYIPVLISGAAVQLTFGLRNYLLDYFDVIHVVRKEYILDIDKETYYGHVSKNGIYISWNRFLEGYSDYKDSVNVGLHEMAHALQFDAFLGMEDSNDRMIKERFNEFSEEGKPVFRSMRMGGSHLLDDYAMTNFDEFWAVSVETFFENPAEFKVKLPQLYNEIRLLLNQDPEVPGKIMDPELA
ncbi:MAG: zinc-dependent peptidase [Chitinophagaceae bacterium]